MSKQILSVTVAILLVGCGGGYDTLPDTPNAGSGLTSHVTNPNNGSKDEPDWKYGSTALNGETFSKTATIYAINTYTVPKYPNVQQKTWVKLEKRKTASDGVSKRVVIFVPEAVKCTPSCDIKFKFNGQNATYRMQQKSEGILTLINSDYEKSLFNKFSMSNTAVISLPLVDLEQPFDSKFNLYGYDKDRMKFVGE